MTHAFLFCEGKVVKPHGKEFQEIIKNLNEVLSINITTKHRYFTWYRCNGMCSNFESYLFGYTAKVCDKTSPDLIRDEKHSVTCGGTFSKTEEPSKEMLRIITQRFKKIKSSKCKKKRNQIHDLDIVEGKTTRVILSKRPSHFKQVDYITSDEEL